MAYPVDPNRTILSNQESINAIAEAEAGILQCMSDLFYALNPNGTLVYNIAGLNDIDQQATFTKDILCAFACKEFAIADIFNSLACRLSLENRSMIGEECDCGCNNR